MIFQGNYVAVLYTNVRVRQVNVNEFVGNIGNTLIIVITTTSAVIVVNTFLLIVVLVL